MTDDERRSRPDLSVLRMDPEELEGRRGLGWFGWLVLLALVVAGAWAALRVLQPSILLPEVEVGIVRQEAPIETSGVLDAAGYTVARKRAAVGAKIIGRVLELPVEEGDRLATGDLIAILDSDDLRAAVAQAEASLLEVRARLAEAEREAARTRRLVESKVAASAELDAADSLVEVVEAQLALAEARLDSATSQLAYTRIVAPIDGVVIEKNVEVGEMVAPGGFTSQQSTGAILRMADPTSLEVEADVAEEYIARLRLGMPAVIAVDAVPDEPYRGRLRQIVPTANRQRAQVEVKVAIEDRDPRLVPDMSCTVTFLEEEAPEEDEVVEPLVLVPTAAVIAGDADAGDRVLVLDGEVVRSRAVELGETRGEQRIVVSGLEPGDEVVVGGHDGLEDGAAVRRSDER
ncbi:MAG: efflux RND transporter periplasmic adaptor subunit [Acidobacteriota bacterium]